MTWDQRRPVRTTDPLLRQIGEALGATLPPGWSRMSEAELGAAMAPAVLIAFREAANAAKYTQDAAEGVWAGARALRQ